MPPAPLPTSTPAPGSPSRSPASAQASRRGNHGDERGPRVAPRIGASASPVAPGTREPAPSIDSASSIDTRGTGAATVQANARGVELGDRARRAAAVAHVLPEPFAAHAVRRDDADPGNRDRHASYNMWRRRTTPQRAASIDRLRNAYAKDAESAGRSSARTSSLAVPQALLQRKSSRCASVSYA